MDGFKQFFESEEKDNVESIISKLPLSHQKLLKGFNIKFTGGNTLKGDKQHIGYIHKDKIVVAAPWHYSRSMTFLHEVAHLVYEKLVSKDLRKKWSDLIAKTKEDQKKKVPKESQNALDQDDEEIFAMSYACYYSKHKNLTYHNAQWMNFIKNLP